jgi:hypothetical protein
LEAQPVADGQSIAEAGTTVATVLDPASATVAVTAGATCAVTAAIPRTTSSKAVVRAAALSLSPPQPSPRGLIKDPHFIISDFDARYRLPLHFFVLNFLFLYSLLISIRLLLFCKTPHPLYDAVRTGSG